MDGVSSINMMSSSSAIRSNGPSSGPSYSPVPMPRTRKSLDRKSNTEDVVIDVKNVDMTDEMKEDVLMMAKHAISQCVVEKDIARLIKIDADNKFGQTWHCIVGRNFGSFVTHEANYFIFFYIDKLAILLFRL